jgi:hypothetical protein
MGDFFAEFQYKQGAKVLAVDSIFEKKSDQNKQKN